MLFLHLRNLKAELDRYNHYVAGEKAEFWFPHMFMDGRWSVTIVFNHNPVLSETWGIIDYCHKWGLHAFFGELNGDIALFVQ